LIKSTFGRTFFALSFLLAAFVLGEAYKAEAAYRKETGQNGRNGSGEAPFMARLASFEFHQMGDSDLMLTISGKAMPAPEVTHVNNTTHVLFREVDGRKVKEEHRESTASLITRLNSEQMERDFAISFTTEKPLRVNSTRGTAPADSYTLRMVTAEQQQRKIEEPLATAQPQSLRVPNTGPFAVTTPITLDLRDADLRDVFRMLGTQIKKNIIIDPSVAPGQTVTMTLKDVPLSEVFGYLMKTYDITYEIMGKDTVIIGTIDGLSKISGKEETRRYQIAYADPAALAGLVRNITNIPDDRIVVDSRLRRLYITTSQAKLEEAAIAIQNLDHPGSQVMLHARIVEFNSEDSLEVENTLNMVYDHWWAQYSRGQLLGGYITDNNWDRPSTWTRIPNSPTPPVNPLDPIRDGNWRMLDMTFAALETKIRSKTLANPSVITVDGLKATIDLTDQFSYVSGRDDGGNATWSQMDIGPKLEMTPKVGREGMVTLELSLEASDRGNMITSTTGEQIPEKTTRKVTTTVRVRNGEPFVVGGLFREDSTNNRLRIPVLGQLPLLGELFTYRQRGTRKTQVVMLVIPYILDTPDVAVEQEKVMTKQY
jgi:type IV pilus assembly protein PilQ